jgi:hypothetical protein
MNMVLSQPIRRPIKENQVDLDSDSEVKYWSEKFDISRELLYTIVKVVGTHPNAVAHELEMGGMRSGKSAQSGTGLT